MATEREIEQAMRALLRARGTATACPSEVARAVGGATWRETMPTVRAVAARLQAAGEVDGYQRGRPIEIATARGAIRLRERAVVAIDYRAHPERYVIGRGEQGVLTVEPYKSELLPSWRFSTPAIARVSAKALYAKFVAYGRAGDFVGMDMARKFLQMGWTRSRRYANHASGRKYAADGVTVAPMAPDAEKAASASVFRTYYERALANRTYVRLRAQFAAARSTPGGESLRSSIPMKQSAQRVIADLEELAELTSDERGAQRVAWGPVWRKTRAWFTKKLETELGITPQLDGAANLWTTLPGASTQSLVIGSHLDSVPGGGWLDGCLGVLAGLEVLRREKAKGTPALTLHLVDWADEEGARFGRSLTGSAASAGALDPHGELAHLVDRQGVKLPDALAENGVTLDGMATARAYFDTLRAVAYLELHIEQGPVLQEMKKPVGVVLGTMGVERHQLRFLGQAAHSGAAPIHLRKDAFLAAAEFALACRDISVKYSGKTPKTRVVATCGVVKVEPNFVTAVPGSTEISIDLRALDAKTLKKMLVDSKAASIAAAKKYLCTVKWSPLLHITPRLFDETLMGFVRDAVREVTGDAPELPSGPLHDAAEMAAIVPTAMVFAQSSPGVSHTRIEDTPRPALDKSIRAFLIAVERTLVHHAAQPARGKAKATASRSAARPRAAAPRP